MTQRRRQPQRLQVSNGHRARVAYVNPSEIRKPDPDEYQRDEARLHIARIASEFDPEYFHVVTLNMRDGDTMYSTIDGQQRLMALDQVADEIAGELKSGVPALVFFNLTPQEEARRYDKINFARKNLTPAEQHKSRLFADEPEDIEIEQIITSLGLALTNSRRSTDPTKIRSFDAIRKIYHSNGAQGLHNILLVAHSAWPDDFEGLSYHVIHGIAAFMKAHPGDVDMARLIAVLSKRNPIRIREQVRSRTGGNHISKEFVKVIEEFYNQDLPRNRRIGFGRVASRNTSWSRMVRESFDKTGTAGEG